jgi:methionyl-tRNA synthetase
MADRHLITSALPYVSGVKHLGNLAGSLLPADVHARFLRQAGKEVLFICATDEHGTPAELAAREADLPVAEYCERLHDLQADIYRRFGLSFDHFGRTSSASNRDLTQHLYRRLDAAGLIEERVIRQYFSPTDDRFLPDRYVVGTCPHCSNPRARGDQCEACTRVLDPTDLIRPRSTLSGADDLVLRDTRHLFLRQSALAPEIERWVKSQEEWPPIVIAIARAWLAIGLHDRCITRDLAWGIPVPRPGFEGKVFYVWFDAPIGYISATQEWANADPTRRDWCRWWWGEDAHREVRYVQFLGKDNVPFHAVSFPATLIGSGEPWKLVDIIKGFNWLTYEGGKFSTSEGRGIFTDAALEELPADLWRWWLVSNAPESSDTNFDFHRFAADVNADLADSFGNLANRLLSFAVTRFGEEVPFGGELGPVETEVACQLGKHLSALCGHHEGLQFRKAAAEVRAIWSLANAYAAASAPWTRLKSDPAGAAVAIRTALNLLGTSARVAWAFIPQTARRVLDALGEPDASLPGWPESGAAAIARLPAGRRLSRPEILFRKIDGAEVERLRKRFSGHSDDDARSETQAPWSRLPAACSSPEPSNGRLQDGVSHNL